MIQGRVYGKMIFWKISRRLAPKTLPARNKDSSTVATPVMVLIKTGKIDMAAIKTTLADIPKPKTMIRIGWTAMIGVL
jgi:precorrin-4 methylase